MYTVYLLSKIGNGKDQRTFFNRQGVGFAPNKDGSINIKLDLLPHLTFQLRENKEKEPDNGG